MISEGYCSGGGETSCGIGSEFMIFDYKLQDSACRKVRPRPLFELAGAVNSNRKETGVKFSFGQFHKRLKRLG